MKNQLEVVVKNKEEAIIAEKAGADRIEISTNPERNGITIDLEDITSIVVTIDIPAYVMVRPASNTYEYTEEEFKKILHTIEICKMAGVEGVSVGFLKEGKIDRDRLKEIILAKGDLKIVFNRAIDSVINYEEEIEYLNKIKEVNYIQTSGGAETAHDGRHRLIPLIKKYPNKLVLSSFLKEDVISKFLDEKVENAIFQVNSGARNNHTYNGYISYDMIKNIKDLIE